MSVSFGNPMLKRNDNKDFIMSKHQYKFFIIF